MNNPQPKQQLKIIIAGSRNIHDYNTIFNRLDYIFRNFNHDTHELIIVSGCANGVDKLGERYAEERGYQVLRFPANWNLHGKSAGYIRNVEMAKVSNMLIAFWDGESKGTRHMIDTAKNKGLNVLIIEMNEKEIKE